MGPSSLRTAIFIALGFALGLASGIGLMRSSSTPTPVHTSPAPAPTPPLPAAEPPRASQLQAPRFTADTPEIFESSKLDSLPISWRGTSGATRYRIIVRDFEGARVRTRSTPLEHANAPQPQTPSGNEFWISVAALDEAGREGMESERRKWLIRGLEPTRRPTSPIRPPSIRTIRLEED